MSKLSFAELRELAIRHGFPNPDLAAAVAMAESGGNPAATLVVTPDHAEEYNRTHPTGPRHGPESSYGLWQVNTLAWPRFDASKLTDPDYCAQAAFTISRGGVYWRPWATFSAGMHLRFLPASELPTVPEPLAVDRSSTLNLEAEEVGAEGPPDDAA